MYIEIAEHKWTSSALFWWYIGSLKSIHLAEHVR